MAASFSDPTGGSYLAPLDAARSIISKADGHIGLTISGGEPFEQAEELNSMLDYIAEHSGLDVLCYSGYTIEDIRSGTNHMVELLTRLDILIDGPFLEEEPTDLIWRGSANQGMHILSERADGYRYFVDMTAEGARRLHISIDPDGSVNIIGIPARGELLRLKDELAARGIDIHQE